MREWTNDSCDHRAPEAYELQHTIAAGSEGIRIVNRSTRCQETAGYRLTHSSKTGMSAQAGLAHERHARHFRGGFCMTELV